VRRTSTPARRQGRPGARAARPQDLRLGQDAARAALPRRRQLRAGAADFKRYKDLRDQGFISSAELERRDTALKTAPRSSIKRGRRPGVQGNQAGYATLVATRAA
jgi:multidrug resistance efflux pump